MRKGFVVAIVLGVLTWAAPAMADTTIGHAGSSFTCNGPAVVFDNSGTTWTVPSGTWRLSSWSTQAGGFGGEMAAVVFRPTATPGSYTVAGTSATETLTANTLNTFSTSILVQPGDILGMWEQNNADCVDGSSGSISYAYQAKPSAGDTIAGLSGQGGSPNIAGVLSSSAVRSEDSMFVCYSKWEQDGGAVFTVSQALDLLASGYWLPSAVAGAVAGGTNVGDYHLVCNPQASLQQTGKYVGGGGDVVGMSQQAGYYPIVA